MFKRLVCSNLIVASLLIGGYGVKCYFTYHFLEYKNTEKTTIYIPKGASVTKISEILHNKKLILNRYVFALCASLRNHISSSYLRAGEYKIDPGINMSELINKLSNGDVLFHKVTIPEGVLTSVALEVMAKAHGMINDLDVVDVSNQATLLPETYFYTYGTKVSELLARATFDLHQFLDTEWDGRDTSIDIVIPSKFAALVLASIIEREAKFDSEKQRIAAVYLNRLKRKMPLQADPTVIFAVTQGKHFNLKLTYSDLKYQSAYNTYINKGLPPGPICNPGKAAINAVLHPARSSELYFVADGLGGHSFADSFQAHKMNVRTYKQRVLSK